MGQLTQQIIYFNDSAGVILPGSRHFFYEAGTTTLQTVYSDKELTTPIVQPVLADASGILQQIWLQPLTYRWVGEDANAVQIFDRDDVNFAESVINTSSSFIFSTTNNMVLGISIGGASIDLQNGQSASTQGSVTAKDGLGEDYIIEAVNPGGSIALNNGRFATELDNFENSVDVDTKISDHNDDPLAHEPLRDRLDNIEQTNVNQGVAITGNQNDISDLEDDFTNINNAFGLHLTDINAHANIITAHNTDDSSHTFILNGLNRIVSANVVGSTGVITGFSTSSDGVTIDNVTRSGTGNYTVDFSSSIDTVGVAIVATNIGVSTNQPIFASSNQYGGTSRSFVSVTVRGSSLGTALDHDFQITVFYKDEP